MVFEPNVQLVKERLGDYTELVARERHTRSIECQRSCQLSTNRIGPKRGFEANTTTAFCTVDRVTSASRTSSAEAAIWRLHL